MWLMLGITILLTLSIPEVYLQDGCSFDMGDINFDKQPLFLNEGFVFLYPNNSESTIVTTGETIELFCGYSDFTAETNYGTITQSGGATVLCQGASLEIDGSDLSFESISCSDTNIETVRETGNTCLENGVELGVAFQYNDTTRALLYTVCFNLDLQIAVYAEFEINRSLRYLDNVILLFQYESDEEYFVSGIDLDDLYYSEQQGTVNALLGLPNDSIKYILYGDSIFTLLYYTPIGLAEAFFFYQYRQQYATYHAVNTVPIWTEFETWDTAVDDILDFITNNDVDLKVFSGTYGISTLPHEDTGEDIELYLYVRGSVKAVPVPALIWRVLYEPVTQAAVVLFTVNNAYIIKDTDVICNDVTNDLGWLTWETGSAEKGFAYACSYEDVVGKIPNFPDLDVSGLLVQE